LDEEREVEHTKYVTTIETEEGLVSKEIWRSELKNPIDNFE
jgi:hypothetical protein